MKNWKSCCCCYLLIRGKFNFEERFYCNRQDVISNSISIALNEESERVTVTATTKNTRMRKVVEYNSDIELSKFKSSINRGVCDIEIDQCFRIVCMIFS